ncbi:MAG: S41 family peptidase [Proteobacteria bacterium]|nr:S41 family peptidase [Pseudomonadota bacterium]
MFKVYSLIISIVMLLLSVSDANAKVLKSDIEEKLDLFSEVFERVRLHYVDELEDGIIIDKAISGMLSGLDPHSSFLDKKSFQKMQEQTSGEFGGLGITVSWDKNVVKVISPIDDTPADKAGIEAGDYIIKIDGEDVEGTDLNHAVEKMRGKVGTKITLTILREGEVPFERTLTREKIKTPSVKSELKDGEVAYVRITTFSQTAAANTKKAIKELRKKAKDKEIKGLVLDLRNNPGGLLNQAVEVSDLFLEQGDIVSTKGRNKAENQIFKASKGDILNKKPIVVLINDGSASASEIVTASLKDNKRAIIMGTKSFGKGSVQSVIPLSGGAGMKLTTALYYTPNDITIQAKGVTPDIEVKQSKLEEYKSVIKFSESALNGHIESGKESDKKDKKPKGKSKKQTKTEKKDTDKKTKFVDYQLIRAIDTVKALALWDSSKK